jgi:excisionase family DNA binding protein
MKKPPIQDEPTVAQAARILGLSIPTIYIMIKDGRLAGICPPVGVKRVTAASIKRYQSAIRRESANAERRQLRRLKSRGAVA